MATMANNQPAPIVANAADWLMSMPKAERPLGGRAGPSMLMGKGTLSAVVRTPSPTVVTRTVSSVEPERAVLEVMVSLKSTLEPAVSEKSVAATSSLMRTQSTTNKPVSFP